MIWTALIEIVLSIVTWLLSVLPDYTPTDYASSDALRYVVSAVHFMGKSFDFPALLGVLGFWVTVRAGVTATRAAQWVYAKIPAKAA